MQGLRHAWAEEDQCLALEVLYVHKAPLPDYNPAG